ncbi:hypothetical protein KJ766_02450, partial [Patescibacteria group bacterium]|nr:hypothetical protein [Patescibacteria group bacterium]
ISDIFVAQEFLDSCCGCLHYIDAHFSIDLSVVFDFFEAERLAVPKLYKIRDQKQKLKEARILKDALTKARLDGESVFKLLDIPFGPKRKDIMRQVRDLVIDKSFKVDFGSSTEEIERRADLARDFLTH